MGKKQLKKRKDLRDKFSQKNISEKDPLKLISFLKECALDKEYKKNFDQSIDMIFHLNLKGKYSIKNGVVLPHMKLKKESKILVFTKGLKLDEASKAGADYVGLNDYIDKITSGWMDFDVVLATPDVMKDVSRLGPILGRKGLMPNPKFGTIGFELSEMIKEFKKGRKLYQADKHGMLALSVGFLSMSESQIYENIKFMYNEVLSKKPLELKGMYIKSVYIGATMTPSLAISFN